MSTSDKISFEDLPQAVSDLTEKVSNTERLLEELLTRLSVDKDRWMSLEELCDYLPGKPAKATIYAKVQHRQIPHQKMGKRLAFLKSEIDQWIQEGARKTVAEICDGPQNFLVPLRKKRASNQ